MKDELLIMLLALLASGFFSSAETVFLTFDRLKLILWKDKKDIFTRAIRVFFPNTDRFILTSLIGVNLANVAFSSMAAVFMVGLGLPPWLVVIISTMVLLTFGEILPKTIVLPIGTFLIKHYAILLFIVYTIMFPLISALSAFLRKLPGQTPLLRSQLSRDSLSRLIMSEHSEIHSDNAKLAVTVLKFAHAKMREVMTPRTEIASLPVNSNLAEITAEILESGHSKLVLFDGDIDHISGYIHAFDLMNNTESVEELIRPVRFVSEFTPVIEGLKILRKRETGLLVVVDEHGGTDGIVTIEDIAEEIVGEIEDEFDKPRFRYKTTGENKYLISGRAEIDDLNREYDFDLEKAEGVETFGGWLVTRLGRIPDSWEKVRIGDLKMEILSASETRVKIVRVEKVD